MPTISQEDWMRMVEALGPDKAEAWRQSQSIDVGMPSAMPDPGTDVPSGALDAPEDEETTGGALGGSGVDRTTFLKDLQALQQEEMDAARSDRDYRRRMFEQGRAELEKMRMGPSTSEQLFALAAAFSQPQQYKGFGGMMANVMPVLAQMSSQTRQADQQRSLALRKLEQDYMSDDQSLSRGERGARRQYLTAMLAATKPAKPGRPLVNPITGEFVDPDTMDVIPVNRATQMTKTVGGATYYRGADGWYDNQEEAAASFGQKTGGPTQPASGGFRY